MDVGAGANAACECMVAPAKYLPFGVRLEFRDGLFRESKRANHGAICRASVRDATCFIRKLCAGAVVWRRCIRAELGPQQFEPAPQHSTPTAQHSTTLHTCVTTNDRQMLHTWLQCPLQCPLQCSPRCVHTTIKGAWWYTGRAEQRLLRTFRCRFVYFWLSESFELKVGHVEVTPSEYVQLYHKTSKPANQQQVSCQIQSRLSTYARSTVPMQNILPRHSV